MATHGPLERLLRSLPGVQLVARHDGFAEIDARIFFRSWTRTTPAVRVLEGPVPEEERDRWLADAIAALGMTDRCCVGVRAGGEWLEIELGGNARGARMLDLVLHTGPVHTLMPYVDVCLLATERDSVLMIRKTGDRMEAFIFRDL